jgi:predicted MFS family arabinose efflux permease
MIETCSTAIITNAFPKNERGRALGLRNSAMSLRFIAGPIIGGVLLNWFNWRSIFYVRIPVWALIFLMGIFLIRKDTLKGTLLKFDISGTITSLTGMFTLISVVFYY